MTTRYADGHAAVTHDAVVSFVDTELTIRIGETTHVWAYADLRRADDSSGRVILKRKPDTGERLYLSEDDGERLRYAEPALFQPKAFGSEGRATIAGLVAGAWSMAALFLVGVPFAAEPIAGQMPPRVRNQISDISWSQVEVLASYCDDSDEASRVLNDLAYRMMTASDVAMRDDIWITIVDAPFPNAFALPDNSIVVTDDLIALAEHPDELTGVIAHEIAHIEHNHVLKNIVRSVGAGIFFDVVVGGAGAGQMLAIASVNLAGLRYSRGDESDADSRGLDYLDAANIDSAGLARLFDRMREELEDGAAADVPTLLSSHPATAERAAAARARARPGREASLSPADWAIVRRACGNPFVDEPAPAPTAPAAPVEQPPAPPPSAPVVTPDMLEVKPENGATGED